MSFNGIYSRRPSRPRYKYTWDPKVVLHFVTSKPENKEFNVQDLSMKLITILTLVTGHRTQTFAFINVEDVIKTTSRIEIRIPKRVKTSRKKSATAGPNFTLLQG